MLSRINRAIVRAESPDELFRNACAIAVESRLFDAAWVGLVVPSTGRLRAMCSAGGIDSIETTLAGAGGFPDTVRKAGEIRVPDELDTLPATMYPAALAQRGICAMAGLPLREHGNVVAILTVFSSDAACFDVAVTDLLQEVTEDICFSLDHQLNEQHRLAAETKLHYMASYDAQTGMPNLAVLEERLPQLAVQAEHCGSLLTLSATSKWRPSSTVPLSAESSSSITSLS